MCKVKPTMHFTVADGVRQKWKRIGHHRGRPRDRHLAWRQRGRVNIFRGPRGVGWENRSITSFNISVKLVIFYFKAHTIVSKVFTAKLSACQYTSYNNRPDRH